MNSLLKTEKLETGFRLRKGKVISLHSDLNFEIQEGQFISVLGPNGAGKSTLLKTVLGYQKALGGKVFYGADPLESLTVKELSAKVAVVLTDKPDETFLTVYDIVATGRYPYTGITGRLTSKDIKAVNEALAMVGMETFATRYFSKLSDGEKQKVMIARAVAQQTPLIILDEPVAYVDAPSKIEIMELLQTLSHEHGKGILMATHDLEAAVRFSDRLWLLGNQGEKAEGAPAELLKNGTINKFFDKKGIVLNKEKMIFEKLK
jgi:iron complex transport system ATP-binding protein